mmetsp:Transcript_37146/g.111272  ORF Transcript_37146/g.111272 Transcript_37146/m.111272 type:complete len:91 (-) Transcript_37146:113-385(-)
MICRWIWILRRCHTLDILALEICCLLHFLKQYNMGETDLWQLVQEDKTGVLLCDFKFYTAMKNLQVLEFGLKRDGKIAASSMDEYQLCRL